MLQVEQTAELRNKYRLFSWNLSSSSSNLSNLLKMEEELQPKHLIFLEKMEEKVQPKHLKFLKVSYFFLVQIHLRCVEC